MNLMLTKAIVRKMGAMMSCVPIEDQQVKLFHTPLLLYFNHN